MKVLLADDEKTIAITLGDALRDAGHAVTVVTDGDQAVNAVKGEAFDCVICDIRMPKVDGLALLKTAKQVQPDTEVILITAYGTDEVAFKAAKDGAFGWIRKPFFNEDVITELGKVEKQFKLRAEIARLREQAGEKHQFGHLLGKAPLMQKLYELMGQVAKSDVSVLIEGENGTGKDLVARQIHHLSARRAGPFDVFSPSTVADTLLEGHLFGWTKGAFTGATRDQAGLFERANGGTVLIDDIDDMPLATQAKFLRVLQEREVERLGDTKRTKVDVRVITATKTDLWKMVEEQKFRQDLLHRLNVAVLKIPPLRERSDDVPLLVNHFMQKYGKGVDFRIELDTIKALQGYHWPGNVRELEHAIERAITFAGPDKVLQQGHLLQRTGGTSKSLEDVVADVESKHIRSVLAQNGGHRGETAKQLGITRKNLWMKMKDYGIE